MSDTVPCQSCGAPMIWTVTEKGKRMPVDASPAPAARGFRIEGDLTPGGSLLARFTAAPQPGEALYQSHFATCPDAGRFRRQ